MLESALEDFGDKIFYHITKQTRNQSHTGLLVKKHSEHLKKLGDVSFPSNSRSWQSYLNNKSSQDELSSVIKDTENLISESVKWNLSVRSAEEIKGRIHLFLERPRAIQVALIEALKNNQTIAHTLNKNTVPVQLDPLCKDLNCVTSLRLKFLSKTIENLYCLSERCQEDKSCIFVTTKSTSECSGSRKILCGTVLNAKTNIKETSINSDDFIRLRQNEMTLIAQHKYGVRVASDFRWKEFLLHLGESAAVFELLETKPSSAVKVNFDASSGSSKGAAFILYNCARLETMLRTFNEKVTEGIYPPLPEIESIDFTLLNQEDEWCLVFNFILGFPSLLKQSIELSNGNCEFRPHLICGFLSSMVRVFSQYYRRVRILTEPRKHLLPVMFARLQMVKILNGTLKSCLKILNIKSVTQM